MSEQGAPRPEHAPRAIWAGRAARSRTAASTDRGRASNSGSPSLDPGFQGRLEKPQVQRREQQVSRSWGHPAGGRRAARDGGGPTLLQRSAHRDQVVRRLSPGPATRHVLGTKKTGKPTSADTHAARAASSAGAPATRATTAASRRISAASTRSSAASTRSSAASCDTSSVRSKVSSVSASVSSVSASVSSVSPSLGAASVKAGAARPPRERGSGEGEGEGEGVSARKPRRGPGSRGA